MTWARTSAAIDSQTRGASSTKVGPISAEIGHHGLRLLDEIDLHPAQQRPAERIDLLHDPGQRQTETYSSSRSLGSASRYCRAMRAAGRAVVSMASFGRAVVPEVVHRMATSSPAGRSDHRLPALGSPRRSRPRAPQLARRHQPRVVVLSHAARIAIDVCAGSGRGVADAEQLVDLLLVLGDHHLGLGVSQQIRDLSSSASR